LLKKGITMRAPPLMLITAFCLATLPVSADEVSDFYKGRQVTFIVGTGPGGGYDTNARVLARHWARHVPGQPNIVIQNMPGSGGVSAAAHVYNVAAKDGSVVAICPAEMLLAEALDSRTVRFDSSKFRWIGTIATLTDILAVYKTTGVATIEDAKKKVVVLGATAGTGSSYLEPALVNALLGTKFNIVKGYAGGSDAITLAMERNEVQGISKPWTSWKLSRPDWIKEGKLNYLLQIGPKDSELPDVPTFTELVSDPKEKSMVDLLELTQRAGRSVFGPPGVPESRVAALRKAFDETMADPEFRAKMKEMNLEVIPRKGAEFEAELTRVMASKDEAAQGIRKKLKLQ
jgi:tripartite-type tricarboxylate transporter receptor subunit TctC